MRINLTNPETGNPETDALFQELKAQANEVFDVPNEYLPEELQDGRSKTTTLAYAEKHYSAIYEKPESEAAKLKRETTRRAAAYRQQEQFKAAFFADGIQYDVDQRRLLNAQIRFCDHAVRAGWITLDDDDE